MRILHFSDVHIGVENYGSTDSNTGLNTRLIDFLNTFDMIVDFALDKEVDLMLFAGDAYKSREPSQTHQREFAKRIARLSQEGMPAFLLLGNHDLPNITSRATALDIFKTLTVPNITIGDSLGTYSVQTRNGGPIQLIALPWIRRSEFLDREETRNLTIDQINQRIQEKITDLINTNIQQLDPSIPAAIVAHASLNTAITSSEQSMVIGRDPLILQSSIASRSLDYVALGHIHKHQILSHNPYIVYSGSIERIDFGEENDEKGFCLIDIDPHQPQGQRVKDFEFHPLDTRRFKTITVTAEENQDPTECILKAIADTDINSMVVRIEINMPQTIEHLLREDEIRSALEEAFFITPIVRRVIRDRRTRLTPTLVDHISPVDALKLYLETISATEERTKTLLRYGENLINEQLDSESR